MLASNRGRRCAHHQHRRPPRVRVLDWVYTWRRTRTLDVVVELSQLAKTEDLGDGASTLDEYLTVKVTNRSDFDIRVVGVAVAPNAERPAGRLVGDWVGLPRLVRARGGEVIEIPASTYAGDLPDSLLQAVVELATGEEIRSIPTSVPYRFGEPRSLDDRES
jgi:hypothetical protein